MSWDILNAVVGVQVLVEGNLVNGSTTLSGDDDGVGKEVLPDLEPSLTILGLDLLGVGHPVAVPVPKGGGVVNTVGINVPDLETSALQATDEETKRSRSIGTGEDVLVHEKTPDEIFELPRLPQTGDLEQEAPIVIKHTVNLSQEAGKVLDTNVLGHLETSDNLIPALGDWNITVIHAQDIALLLRDTSASKTIVTPLGLVATKSDTSDMGTIVDGSEFGKSTPTAADIEHTITGLDANFFADDLELVVLDFLERFGLVDVADDTGGVDHTGTKEPGVEVVTSVVVVTDLFLIL